MDRTTPTYCKILPIILGIILNSFAGIIYLALERGEGGRGDTKEKEGGREEERMRGYERGEGEGRREGEEGGRDACFTDFGYCLLHHILLVVLSLL